MTLREYITKVWRNADEPFLILKPWAWKRNPPKRWAAVVRFLKARLAALRDTLEELTTARGRKTKRIRYLKSRIAEVEVKLSQAPGNDKLAAELVELRARLRKAVGFRNRLDERIHRLRKRIRWVGVKYGSARDQLAKARKLAQESADGVPPFESWMLNGNSGNIDDDLKPVVAYLVVVCDQYVTDTYDYGGHTSSSLHYPWNDWRSPQQGRAIDCGGPDMAGAQAKVQAKFGTGAFLELFGPRSTYVKNGAEYSTGGGSFPGHSDHIHAARDGGD